MYFLTIDAYEAVCGINILSLPEDSEWTEEQFKDKFCCPFIRLLKSNELPDDNTIALSILRESSNYTLRDDVLFKITNESNDISIMCKVVPSTWRKMITMKYHDSMYRGAHAGRDKTLTSLSEVFYFANMADYVALYVKTCHICQRVKDPKSKSWTPLGDIEASFPLDLISLYFWNPGVKSRTGNKYVLTIIDGFSKFVQIVAIPDKEAETVAKALMQFITTF